MVFHMVNDELVADLGKAIDAVGDRGDQESYDIPAGEADVFAGCRTVRAVSSSRHLV